MVLYRKKPIEAVQFNGQPFEGVRFGIDNILILDNMYVINEGDWIITENGKRYPCKPDTFEAMYEKV